MPGERSAAVIGKLGKRVRSVVVTTPLPAPLSGAIEPGTESGDGSWTQVINSSAHGRVTVTVLAAYVAEPVPQSSDDGDLDMNGGS